MEADKNKNPEPVTPEPEAESLEAQTTSVEGDGAITDATKSGSSNSDPKKKGKRGGPKGFLARLNIYLLLFIFLIILAGVGAGITYLRSKKVESDNKKTITTEPLSEEALEQLRQTDVKVGDPKQILSVESNAIFAGQVLVRGGLEVAGEVKVGAPMTLPGVTVTGTSLLGQVTASQLQVSGTATVQGQFAVQNNMSVSGNGTFGGTLTAGKLNIQDLQIAGDLVFARHIDAGGGTPGKSDGASLGSGGTSSVSGTDTAGTVAINLGGGPAVGCFVTVTFTQRFNSVPHVVITPVGSAAASMDYYINRTNTNFSISTASPPPAGQSFAFDYIVID
jgi:cytoskeletal protein CcmA (bactofilin family)